MVFRKKKNKKRYDIVDLKKKKRITYAKAYIIYYSPERAGSSASTLSVGPHLRDLARDLDHDVFEARSLDARPNISRNACYAMSINLSALSDDVVDQNRTEKKK